MTVSIHQAIYTENSKHDTNCEPIPVLLNPMSMMNVRDIGALTSTWLAVWTSFFPSTSLQRKVFQVFTFVWVLILICLILPPQPKSFRPNLVLIVSSAGCNGMIRWVYHSIDFGIEQISNYLRVSQSCPFRQLEYWLASKCYRFLHPGESLWRGDLGATSWSQERYVFLLTSW